MKMIGPEIVHGADPATAKFVLEFEKNARRFKDREAYGLQSLKPRERFLSLISKSFEKPKRYGIDNSHDFWRLGDSVCVELNRGINLSDVAECSDFVVHLQRLYVVDSEQGNGLGRWAVGQIKRIADESGCCVTLFAKPFAFSKDGVRENLFTSFADLWCAIAEESWDVVYKPSGFAECVKFFYSDCGFKNICLYDSWVYSRPKEDDLPFESQFIYLPKTLEGRYLDRLRRRMIPGLCGFCNRT